MLRILAVFLVGSCIAIGCDDKHADEHGSGAHEVDDHGGEHDDHDGEEHGDEHGHDHDDEVVRWTSFGGSTQLYAEYPPLHENESATIRVHLTRLDDWRPLNDAAVTVVLDVGGSASKMSADRVAPGIYEANLSPKTSGSGTLRVETAGDTHSREVAVSQAGDHADLHEGHDDDGHDHAEVEKVAFGLEQQWSIDFGLQQVVRDVVRPSFDAFGSLEPRLGGEGVVYADSRGRISGDDIPSLGDRVTRGQTLAWLTPSIAEQGDFASLDLAVRQATTRLKAAKVERDRLARLVGDGVVPRRRLIEAEFAVEQAESEVSAAKSRLGQARGVTSTGKRPSGSIPLKSPIDGVVVGVDVPPGLIVESGRQLFRIVDPDPIWLRVDVPEAHITRLENVSGVWFTAQGFEEPFELYDVPVAVGGTVSPKSRTLPVIVEVPNPGGRLRPGMFANVRVVEGGGAESVVVPKRAIVFEDGVPVAYAMVDAERFERRSLQLGPRTAHGFVVERGLEAGEWVVTDGAFAVRLASMGEQEGGGHHGHAH
jgi:RND family efflux transporter MFP subunit